MRIKGCDISLFRDQVVSIVGGGPSLSGFDFSRLQRPIIGVNDAGIKLDCDMMVALDKRLIKKYSGDINHLGIPLVTNGRYAGYPENLVIATCDKRIPLDLQVRQSLFSGLFAMLVALTLGARKLFLFGFDGGFSKNEPQNWYPSLNSGMISWHYEMQNDRCNAFAKYDIINVGMGSKITTFPKIDLTSDFYKENKIKPIILHEN